MIKYKTLILGIHLTAIPTALSLSAHGASAHKIPKELNTSEYERPFKGHRRMRKLRFLKRADTNADGIVTLNEVELLRAKRFDRFDNNKDGIISKQEIESRIRARIEKRIKRMMRKFDRNEDGNITRKEFNWLAAERFKWRDLNDDKQLTPDELPRKYFNHMSK